MRDSHRSRAFVGHRKLLFALGVSASVALSCGVVQSVHTEGPVLAKRLQTQADMLCIEGWASHLAASEPRVRGGTDIDPSKWPECVRALQAFGGVQKVYLEEDGTTTLIIQRTWRLTAGATPKRDSGRWPVGDRSYLWYVES